MSKAEIEFCRRQAERMYALAEHCIDQNICDQVEKMAKDWADRAFAKGDRLMLHLLSL